jgi:outer membrane protein assembly factor BamB
MFSSRRPRVASIALSALVLFGLLLAAGCTTAPTQGWSGPTFSEGAVYVGTIQGNFVALTNLSDNSPRVEWQEPFNPETAGSALACGGRISKAMSTYGTPAIGEERVYIGDHAGYIYSFRIDGGDKRDYDTGAAVIGSPLIADGTVFVGNSDGKFFAFDLQLNPKWGAPFEARDKIWATPAFRNSVVYIASSDHKLYAIDAETGKEIWHFEAEGAILSTPEIANETIYIGASDSKFYAIEAATEDERLDALAREEGSSAPSKPAKWTFSNADNWFWTKALVHDGRVWAGCLDKKMYVIDENNPEDYSIVFEADGMIQTPPVLMDDLGIILVGSEDGNIYAIDPETETSRVLLALDSPVLAPMSADQERGVIYVHAQDGAHTLYALDVEAGKILGSYLTSSEA